MAAGHNSPMRYVHALGWQSLNRLYDPLIQLTMRERRFKQRLTERAGITPGNRVLDVGCGTGTLLLMVRRDHAGSPAWSAV